MLDLANRVYMMREQWEGGAGLFSVKHVVPVRVEHFFRPRPFVYRLRNVVFTGLFAADVAADT